METLEELRSTLNDFDQGATSLRIGQLMDEVLGDTLNVLGRSEATGLEQWASVTGSLAKELLSRSEPGPATWRVWYAGQLQAVAGLVRALLGRRLSLSTTAMVRQANKVPILAVLAESDLKISHLAKRLDLDDSQVIREMRDLGRHQLVETSKVGRERWVRITLQGRRALAEAGGAMSAEAVLRAEKATRAAARSPSRVSEEELARLFPSLAGLAPAAVREVAEGTSLLAAA
jgi:DNA-binding MarR family transcriptional regulator